MGPGTSTNNLANNKANRDTAITVRFVQVTNYVIESFSLSFSLLISDFYFWQPQLANSSFVRSFNTATTATTTWLHLIITILSLSFVQSVRFLEQRALEIMNFFFLFLLSFSLSLSYSAQSLSLSQASMRSALGC